MTTDADDDRIVSAIAHLHSAMSLLNAAGALQSAAHVASAIFSVPATSPARSEPALPRIGAKADRSAPSWSDALAYDLNR